MAYDEQLAERVRGIIAARDTVTEKKMFGGVGWMVGGNMACGVMRDDLCVRVGPDGVDEALAAPHTRPFEMRGRPTKGFILVAPDGLASDADLARWVDAGANHAASLPPK